MEMIQNTVETPDTIVTLMPKIWCHQWNIFYVDLGSPENADNHLMRKIRPCIVVSNERFNRNSDCMTIIPVTHNTRKWFPSHAAIHQEQITGVAKAEMIMTLPQASIKSYCGHLSPEEIRDVRRAMEMHFAGNDW